ncbi:hypothetical protein KP509_22G037100 [Ceratopteris richardii]|uniref:Uncharacterized protein n=1 Tax=Ceratopteris richardii TaxID=49495 RepID=A0A8T2S635_CERRI|nr:hypothetical protein KP509_22G037100 [Ceratopteris richardii]
MYVDDRYVCKRVPSGVSKGAGNGGRNGRLGLYNDVTYLPKRRVSQALIHLPAYLQFTLPLIQELSRPSLSLAQSELSSYDLFLSLSLCGSPIPNAHTNSLSNPEPPVSPSVHKYW